MELITPDQKFFTGDLVRVTKDKWPYLKMGMVGIITLARCDKVCVNSGFIAEAGDGEGSPRYGMEWCYVCRFGNDRPQGVRLDKLSPVEVIIGKR
jgi:hypothetical protein